MTLPVDPDQMAEELACKRLQRRIMLGVVLLFALTCAIAVALHGFAGCAVVAWVLVSLLYRACVRSGFLNEIEGALVCMIVLILCLLIIPAVGKVRVAAEKQRQKAIDSQRE